MEQQEQTSYVYSLRVLEEKLRTEETFLIMFNKYKDTEYGQTNIQCCEARMKDLNNGIELIKKEMESIKNKK